MEHTKPTRVWVGNVSVREREWLLRFGWVAAVGRREFANLALYRRVRREQKSGISAPAACSAATPNPKICTMLGG